MNTSKKSRGTILFVDFSKVFDSVYKEKIKQILQAYGFSKETVTVIIMLYKDIEAMVHLPDGDTDYFDIFAGILQEDTLAHFLWIICLDYVLQALIDLRKINGLTLKIQEADYSQRKLILMQTTWMIYHFLQIYMLKVNLHCIARGRQQEALVSI